MQKITTDKGVNFNDIIRIIKEDPHKGMELFYEKYSKSITTVARNYTKSQDEVNVIVNSVLIKIWRSAQRLDEIKNPDGYVYTVAKNCAKDQVSKNCFYQLIDNLHPSKDCFEEIIDMDNFNYIISELGSFEKEIITFRFTYNKTFEEIAKQFKKRLPTITTIYYRAIQKLKKIHKNLSIE